MSRWGNCWDNAPQKSFFGHMKDEIGSAMAQVSSFEETRALIDDWMDYYNNDRGQWLLAKLSPNEFHEHFPDPKSITPHVLRHSKAMHLLETGVNIIYIRDILGHVNVSTTEVYARANLSMKQTALEKVSHISSGELPSWATDSSLLDWLDSFNRSLR